MMLKISINLNMKTLLMTTILTLSTVSFARESIFAEQFAERRAAQVEAQREALRKSTAEAAQSAEAKNTELTSEQDGVTAKAKCHENEENKKCC